MVVYINGAKRSFAKSTFVAVGEEARLNLDLVRLSLASALTTMLLPPIAAQTGAGGPTEVKEQPVIFQVESVKMAGTVLRPTQKGPLPGIVLLAGSGPGTRDHLRILAERFAKLGFAALIFDKRGSGESGGSWADESLDDLADDAVAAATFLKSQPDIDSQRVGVWGISQAGWVIPRAMARAPGMFTFAIVITGGAVSPLEVELADYSAALDRAGVTGPDKAEAMALVDRYFAYLKTGDGRAGLEQAIQAARDKPWSKVIDLGRVMPTESARAKWAWVPTYDPAADIEKMNVPVLVVIGGKDRPTLSSKALDTWRNDLAASAVKDGTLLDFLNAEHGVAVPGTHQKMHSGGPPTYVPGYLDMVDAWLRAHEAP
jgi:dienelactone hydrolase